MSRVEKIGDCTLYLADCMDVLPTLPKVDAVVTDPPYGLGERMQGGTWGSARKYTVMRDWDKEAPQSVVDSILALGRPSVLWGGNYFSLPPSRCWLSWSKLNAVPSMASMELAWTNLDRPSKEIRLAVGSHDSGHPTQKPTPLMAWCLGFLPDSQTILDPFMGSGTTGVVCTNLGRKFIGIEIDETYFEIAVRRIQEAYAQPSLFEPEPQKQEQSYMFGGGS